MCRRACPTSSPQVYNPWPLRRNPCKPLSRRKSSETFSARPGISWEFSRIGIHSRCVCVLTPSSPFSISYSAIARPPASECRSESSVLHTECVCRTQPAFLVFATARCRKVSAEGEHQERRLRSARSEEHTSELQSLTNLVCRLLLE